VNAPAGPADFLAAWVQAQQALAQFAGSGAAGDPAAGPAQQLFADGYRRFFAAPGLLPAGAAGAAAGGAALQRYQAAAQRFGTRVGEAAIDAGRRLGEALAASGPQAPPIRTLRELRAVWIDCGEAAWASAAHREAFAAALAELLAAWVELRAAGPAP
jgi:hypothetical protein